MWLIVSGVTPINEASSLSEIEDYSSLAYYVTD